MPFFNLQKGENDYRNDFTINHPESYVAKLELGLVTLDLQVRHTTD